MFNIALLICNVKTIVFDKNECAMCIVLYVMYVYSVFEYNIIYYCYYL